ncbi:MAG: Spy/CpxP family protein refolding chaperone [Caldimonas sp.]
MKLLRLVYMIGLALAYSTALAASPYVGEEARDIKALSPEEVGALLAGKGMGLAKTAELNGFAGPSHVLELATELHLTPRQRVRTEALFASMSAKASSAGRALIDKERELEKLFATRTITPQRLSSTLRQIGLLQAQVRDAHLEAHLVQVEILTPEQNARYVELRGYGAQAEQRRHPHRH